MAAPAEGPVSRYLNRRASVPIANILAHTPLTPNTISVFALGMALCASFLLGWGRNVEGAVLIQLSSIVDGVDGDLARAKGMATRFGGIFDAVLDRYADAAVAAGMAWYAYRYEDWPAPAVVGFVAAVGFVVVSYSRARIEATPGGRDVASALIGFASRDVRLLLLAVGALIGQCWWTLVVVSAISYATLGWRLVALRRTPEDA